MEIARKSKIISYLVILVPILNIYASPINGLGLGDIALIFSLPFLLIKSHCLNRITNRYNLPLVLLLTYSLLTSLINVLAHGYSLSDSIIRNGVSGFYLLFIILITSTGVFDEKRGIKLYKILSFSIFLILMLQTIAFRFLGTNFYFMIPSLRYNQEGMDTYDIYTNTYNSMYTYSFRPTAIFIEPSHAALYLSPCLFLLLISKQTSLRSLFLAVCLSIGIILTTSATGYLLVFFSWFCFVAKDIKKSKKASAFILVPLLSVFVIIFAIATPYFSTILDRIQDIGSGKVSSVNMRLTKGFDFYATLPFMQQLFGMGSGTYDSYVQVNSLIGTNYEFEYMNSISYVLCSTGLVGFVIFAVFFLQLFLTKGIRTKGIAIILLLLYLTGSILYSTYDFLLFIFALAPLANLKNQECVKSPIAQPITCN